MYQNSSCITFPGVASHISNETPCSCCKNQGIRVKKNFTANTVVAKKDKKTLLVILLIKSFYPFCPPLYETFS